jgi:hypothetical protein
VRRSHDVFRGTRRHGGTSPAADARAGRWQRRHTGGSRAAGDADRTTVARGDRWRPARARRRGGGRRSPHRRRGGRTTATSVRRVGPASKTWSGSWKRSAGSPSSIRCRSTSSLPKSSARSSRGKRPISARRIAASSGPPRRSCAPSVCSTAISISSRSSTRSRPRVGLVRRQLDRPPGARLRLDVTAGGPVRHPLVERLLPVLRQRTYPAATKISAPTTRAT